LYVIAVSVLIAIVSSAFLLLAFLHRIEFDSEVESLRLIRNARSGINLAMLDPGLEASEQAWKTDLFESGGDSVILEKKNWGLFHVVVSKAFFKRQQHVAVALTGYAWDPNSAYALYLAAQSSPLTLCGQTLISGGRFLPASGVVFKDLDGKVCASKVIGITHTSASEIPKQDEAMKILKALMQGGTNIWDSLVESGGRLSGDSIFNSFMQKTICFHAMGPLILDHFYAHGNVSFSSENSIYVKANSHLKDVLLIAPSVFFEDGFVGSVQVFANDSLIIGSNCKFEYPSVAAMVQKDKAPHEAFLRLKDSVQFSGVLYLVHDSYNAQYPTQIVTSKGDVITGQIITNGALELKGCVNGSVTCSSFILHSVSGIYSNYLQDAKIDITKLSDCFVGIAPEAKRQLKIIKWLF
jgi:hypothetical protein